MTDENVLFMHCSQTSSNENKCPHTGCYIHLFLSNAKSSLVPEKKKKKEKMLKSHNCLLSTVFKTSQGPSIFKNTVFYISMKSDICGILTLNLNISIAEKQCPPFLPNPIATPHNISSLILLSPFLCSSNSSLPGFVAALPSGDKV